MTIMHLEKQAEKDKRHTLKEGSREAQAAGRHIEYEKRHLEKETEREKRKAKKKVKEEVRKNPPVP